MIAIIDFYAEIFIVNRSSKRPLVRVPSIIDFHAEIFIVNPEFQSYTTVVSRIWRHRQDTSKVTTP